MSIENKKILIVGASSDLAVTLNEMLYSLGTTIGLHYNKNEKALLKYDENERLKRFQENLNSGTRKKWGWENKIRRHSPACLAVRTRLR